MRSLKEIRDRWFEKKWEKKLPQKYKDLSRGEIEQQLNEVKAELAEFFKNDDFTMKELEEIMDKHGEFLDMAEKWRQYYLEKKLRGM